MAARCLSPFSTVVRNLPSEKGDRHHRQTRNSGKNQSVTEPVPIFGLPAYSLSTNRHFSPPHSKRRPVNELSCFASWARVDTSSNRRAKTGRSAFLACDSRLPLLGEKCGQANLLDSGGRSAGFFFYCPPAPPTASQTPSLASSVSIRPTRGVGSYGRQTVANCPRNHALASVATGWANAYRRLALSRCATTGSVIWGRLRMHPKRGSAVSSPRRPITDNSPPLRPAHHPLGGRGCVQRPGSHPSQQKTCYNTRRVRLLT